MAKSQTDNQKECLKLINNALASGNENDQYVQRLYSMVDKCVDSITQDENTTEIKKSIKDILPRLFADGCITVYQSSKRTLAGSSEWCDAIAATATLAYVCAQKDNYVNLDTLEQLYKALQHKISAPEKNINKQVKWESFAPLLVQDDGNPFPWITDDNIDVIISKIAKSASTLSLQALGGVPNKKQDTGSEAIDKSETEKPTVDDVKKPESPDIGTTEKNQEVIINRDGQTELFPQEVNVKPLSKGRKAKTLKGNGTRPIPFNLQKFLNEHPNISYDAFKAYLIENHIDPNTFMPNNDEYVENKTFGQSERKPNEDQPNPDVNSSETSGHENNGFNSEFSFTFDNSNGDPLHSNGSFVDMSGDSSSVGNESSYEFVNANDDEGLRNDQSSQNTQDHTNPPPPPNHNTSRSSRPIITDDDDLPSNNQVPPEFRRTIDEPNPTKARVRTPMHFRLPYGFGRPSNAGIWNTPVITDFGYPFLNFSSEAMLHLFKTKDLNDKKRTFKNIKKMLKEAKKRYGGIWKAIYGAPLELFKKFANDPGTLCVPNYLKVDAEALNDDSDTVSVTPIKYFSVDPAYQASVDVPRAYLENFYDILDYTKTFKTYVKFADGLTMQEFYDEITENGGTSPFYLLVPKQAKYSRTKVSTGSLFSALFGGTRCNMIKTLFKGRRGCFLIETKSAKNLFSDIN